MLEIIKKDDFFNYWQSEAHFHPKIINMIKPKVTMKNTLFLLSALFLGSTVAQSQMLVSVQGTVDTTLSGFNSGEAFAFTFTVGDQAASSGDWDSGLNHWSEEYLNPNGILLQGITGTNLTGSYSTPSADNGDPYSRIAFADTYFIMLADADASPYLPGLKTSSSADIVNISIYTDTTAFANINNDTVDPGLETWLAANTGNYVLTESNSYITTSDGTVYLTPASVTIGAVPEPSTYAAFAGLFALGFVAYRRRKA